MQSVKTNLIIFVSFFLISCFGPIKEINYQIEDSFDDPNIFVQNPTPINPDFVNSFPVTIDLVGSFSENTSRNIYVAYSNDCLFYASSSTGILSSFDLNKKSIKWSYKHNNQITSGLTSGFGYLFFVDYLGYSVALSMDGQLVWKSIVGEVFSPPLVINEKTVIFRTSDNNFKALSLIDGSKLWEYKAPSSPLPVRSWGELTYSDGILYSGISSGKVIAINSDSGLLLWENTFSSPKGTSELERSNDMTSKVLQDSFALYVVSSKGHVAAISKIDGSILWSRPLSSFIGMSHDDDKLFITHNTGSIYALSKDTSKVIWRNSDLIGRDVSRPFIYQNFVVVSDYEGYLHFLELSTGRIKTRNKVSDQTILNLLKTKESEYLIAVSINGDINLVNLDLNNFSFDNNSINAKDNIYLEDINESNTKDNNSKNDNSIIDSLIFWD